MCKLFIVLKPSLVAGNFQSLENFGTTAMKVTNKIIGLSFFRFSTCMMDKLGIIPLNREEEGISALSHVSS